MSGLQGQVSSGMECSRPWLLERLPDEVGSGCWGSSLLLAVASTRVHEGFTEVNMDSYVLLRNLIREDGSVVPAGKPVPADLSEEALEQMLAKGTVRKKRVYKPAPKKSETGE